MKDTEVEQKKTCEACLKESIEPFVKELLLANSPKELETLQEKYELEQGKSTVAQELKEKFFNPVELVWFDHNVYNQENKFNADILREGL